MRAAVWDTFVKKMDGNVMHFDIVVPDHIKDESVVYAFGRDYLKAKNMEGLALASEECRFCHIEKTSPDMEDVIQQKGYYIIEMQGCN